MITGAMDFRFRRRSRIAPDLNNSGGSESIVRRAAGIIMRSHSTRTTVGIPGTGIGYMDQMLRTPVRLGHPKTGGIVAAIALTAFVLLAIALA